MMDKYTKAIQENICAFCVDSNEKGHCTLNAAESCAVQTFLPEIVEVIHSTNENEIEAYRQQLRERVCSKHCRTKTAEGNCHLRDDANCSLDRYWYRIVETIQQVDAANA